MKKIIGILSVLSLLIISCGDKNNAHEVRIAKGGKVYGGNFRFMSPEKVTTLLPTTTTDIYTSRLVSQVFEPLMSIDPQSMEVIPAIANKFEVNSAGDEYTLSIRKRVYFHDDPCFSESKHELTAEDVKFSLEMACSGLKLNGVGFHLVNRIQGAKEFNEKSGTSLPKEGVSGIQVIDAHTIKIKLNMPMYDFNKVLAQTALGIFPKEAYDKYGDEIGKHPVGTGPFMLEEFGNEKVTLTRNPYYWGTDELGNKLPFMDTLTVTFIEEKRDELMAFRAQEIDMVFEIPVEDIEHILGTLQEAQEGKNVIHRVLAAPSLSTGYIGYNNKGDLFSDVRVRRAINLAVNRNLIVNDYLEGEGLPNKNGFVPEFLGYQADKVVGHQFSVENAKLLLKQAGYPNGHNFPVLNFYANGKKGSITHKMAQGVADQLKKGLNINVKIILCSLIEKDAAVNDGSAHLWTAGWLADYMDAENFLAIFYSKNIVSNGSVNQFQFVNEKYDALYEKAMVEMDNEKREELLIACDQVITDEGAVMPIMTGMQTLMINARLRNFFATSVGSLDVKSVYIKELRK